MSDDEEEWINVVADDQTLLPFQGVAVCRNAENIVQYWFPLTADTFAFYSIARLWVTHATGWLTPPEALQNVAAIAVEPVPPDDAPQLHLIPNLEAWVAGIWPYLTPISFINS